MLFVCSVAWRGVGNASPQLPPAPDKRVSVDINKYLEAYVAAPDDAAAENRVRRAAWLNGLDYTPFRIPLRADSLPPAEGEEKSTITLDPGLTELGPEVGAAWLAFAATLSAAHHKPPAGTPPNPSRVRTMRQWVEAYEMMIAFWAEIKGKKKVANEAIDAISSIRQEKLLSAYVYLAHFDDDEEAGFKSWEREHRKEALQFIRKHELKALPAKPDSSANRTETESGKHGQFRSPDRRLDPEQREKALLLEPKLKAIVDDLSARPSKARLAELALAKSELATVQRLLERWNEAAANACSAYRLALETDQARLKRALAMRCVQFLGRSDLETALADVAAVLESETAQASRAEFADLLTDAADAARRRHNFELAIDYGQRAWLAAHEMGSDPLAGEALRALAAAYTSIYRSISWNPFTGREREGSAADFVNDGGVGSGSDKYGRRSPEEDEATFATLTTGECRDVLEGTSCRLEAHVQAELERGNLVPAIKHAYFKFVDPLYEILPPADEFTVLNGVRVPSRDISRAVSATVRGNLSVAYQLMAKAGMVLEEEMRVEGNSLRVGRAMGLEAIEEARKEIVRKGEYVPDHLEPILRLLIQGKQFAEQNGIGEGIAGSGGRVP